MNIDIEGTRIELSMTDAEAMRLVSNIMDTLAKRAERPMPFGHTIATGCPVIIDGKAYPGVFTVSIPKAE